MRVDLPRGLQSAQLVHAAGESARGLPKNARAVVVTTRSEAELAALTLRLDARSIAYVPIYADAPDGLEAGFNGELMAIGIFPRPREEVRRLLSSLPLLK